ncbi:hypothetical protein OBBRIDRAFT_447879 [Obba rivulosa]|uniref:Uncharacterized protein n=1 Tax=Obba rivulosa TaxID=1052685 RepID=A0A8E2DUA1_9APHY|nr:hypothetical protein OBBRIDRAFT_447879 [Obba rivulosa]
MEACCQIPIASLAHIITRHCQHRTCLTSSTIVLYLPSTYSRNNSPLTALSCCLVSEELVRFLRRLIARQLGGEVVDVDGVEGIMGAIGTDGVDTAVLRTALDGTLAAEAMTTGPHSSSRRTATRPRINSHLTNNHPMAAHIKDIHHINPSLISEGIRSILTMDLRQAAPHAAVVEDLEAGITHGAAMVAHRAVKAAMVDTVLEGEVTMVVTIRVVGEVAMVAALDPEAVEADMEVTEAHLRTACLGTTRGRTAPHAADHMVHLAAEGEGVTE